VIKVGHDVPERFAGLEASETTVVKFRCPHCGIGHQATVLPGSPQVAKYFCRQCERTIEVETRPSAMDSFEQEFDLRRDMVNVQARPKAFSKSVSPKVHTRFGPAYLIG
jgi:transposase-like protein